MLVINSDQLGAKEKHVANASKLMSGDNVHHYWDGEKHVGKAIQPMIEGLSQPAWDFWMLYEPGRTWGEAAPEPDWWEHQLGGLPQNRKLDAVRFAEKAKKLARQ